jgi:hypothetical protein
MPLVIPPEAARRFRAVVQKCRPPRSRDPAPLVFARARDGTLTLFANLNDVAVALAVPAAGRTGWAVASLDDLDRTDALGRPARFDAPRKDAQPVPRVPPLPDELAQMSPMLLGALHEAGRTAARDPGRYAVTRIQIKGGAGQVIGTDGKQLLVQGGYTFPFAGDVLVPALPVFGSKELSAEGEVRVGRTDTHLVVAVGPWTVWLALDAGGRFPDVDGVIPRSRLATTVEVGDPVAAAAVVKILPVADDDEALTLDLGPRLILRVRGDTGAPPLEAIVPDTTVSGPPMAVAVHRRQLVRALDLGFRAFRFASPERPWVASDPTRTYLAVTLNPECVVPPADRADVRPPRLDPEPIPQAPTPEDPMPAPNGSSTNGHPGPDGAADPADVLHPAETLKADLADAHASATPLVAPLKTHRRQRRTVESALASLRSLRLE